MMIPDKFILTPNEDKQSVIVSYCNKEEDYIFEQIPNGITREEMIDVIEEVKRVTKWEQ